MKWRVVLAASALAACVAVPASAKTYSAERFDSSIRVLSGGDLEVTETVVFRFEDGEFEHVFRDIPKRMTDSIEVVRATMDGRDVPFGEGPGQVEVNDESRVRVRWRFAPLSNSSHTFTLTYRVHGVIYPKDGADLLQWRALPNEHNYSIERSTIEIAHLAALVRQPILDSHRLGDARIEQAGQTVRIVASGIRPNGWVRASLHFAPGAVISAPPEWLRLEEQARAFAPRWITAAAVIAVIGLIVLWMLRQRYDAPRRDVPVSGGIVSPPDTLAPAIAGAVAANGRVSIEHAMATLFALAERGEIEIKEEPKSAFGQRNFSLVRRRTRPLSSSYEQAAVDIAFRHKNQDETSTHLNKARTRLAGHFRPFKEALHQDMLATGLIDPDRKAVYARYGTVSLSIILASVPLFIAMAFLIREYGGWPLLIPGALIFVSVVGFILQAATTPLSNEGVHRRDRWRAYQKHLKRVAAHKEHLTSSSPAGLLPFAVTLGLASSWASFMKSQPNTVPAWFHAIASSDDAAFPAFIAAGGASAGGGAGGAAGGAGGGASGAG